jgi:hypothetical protein
MNLPILLQQLAERIHYDDVLSAINSKIAFYSKVFITFAHLVDAKFFLFGNVLKEMTKTSFGSLHSLQLQ